jgi:hypothetical protein
MKNRVIPGLAGILLLMMVIVSGCGSGNATTGATNTTSKTSATTTVTGKTTATTKPTTTSQPKTTTASGETLSELLGLTGKITSLKYDMVITSPAAQPMTTSIWVKKNKMRTEMTQEGTNTVLLMDIDAKTMYMYTPAQKTALKLTWNPSTKSATDEAMAITNYSPTILGTETLDGKVCTVVQYTVSGQTTKMWLWKEHGLPIRVEATTPQGLMVMEYKNIEFVDIADSMFTLPADVQITTMPGT